MTEIFKWKHSLLQGKSNFIEWHEEALLYLQVHGFLAYCTGEALEPLKSLYYNEDTPKTPELGVKYEEKLAEYIRNSSKALGALKSIISQEIRERYKDKTTPLGLYTIIKETFGESSL